MKNVLFITCWLGKHPIGNFFLTEFGFFRCFTSDTIVATGDITFCEISGSLQFLNLECALKSDSKKGVHYILFSLSFFKIPTYFSKLYHLKTIGLNQDFFLIMFFFFFFFLFFPKRVCPESKAD